MNRTMPTETANSMRQTDYDRLYDTVFSILGDLTPLCVDCGVLCGGACCKGDELTGMRLFPHERTDLPVKETEAGRLAVCNGTCERSRRPLACRIFPFFPTIDEKGRVYVEADDRARRLCPLIVHSDEIVFDPRFFKALKKVGKLLARDEACRAFMEQATEEIDLYRAFLMKSE